VPLAAGFAPSAKSGNCSTPVAEPQCVILMPAEPFICCVIRMTTSCPAARFPRKQDSDPAACLLQSLIAPLASAPECGRPESAACYTYTHDQRCTGRLASGGAVLGQSNNRTTAAVQPQSSLVQRAHQRNLIVHAYTFRNEVSHSCITMSFAECPHLVSCTEPVLCFSASILDCLVFPLNIPASRQYVKALQAS